MNNEIDRSEYKSEKGLTEWWAKDGAWHVAFPCPDPNEQGLRTGGFRWTAAQFSTRDEAIRAIES